ncbi:MAG: DMT family transporter [Gammaproteobacteria bacterium]|nr:DMT family transporter [Gammaproteobacteria bacterium]
MSVGFITKSAPWVFLLLWCGGFTVAKIGFTGAEPFTLLSVRYFSVVLCLLPCLLFVRPAFPNGLRAWLHVAWVGFLIQVIYFGAAWVAMNNGGSAASVALITSLQPILVALALPYISNERVSLKGWFGLFLGLIGCVWVILANNEVELVSMSVFVFAVLALLGMSLATVWEKRYGVSHHIIVSSLIQYSVGFMCTLPVAMLTETMRIELSPSFLFALAYLVLCNSILAISLLLMMIRQGEVTRVTSLFFLVPPGTALIALLVLGEPMHPLAWVGMLVAVSGVWLVGRAGKLR